MNGIRAKSGAGFDLETASSIKSLATNITNYFLDEEPSHVVLIFTDPITGTFKFNYETSGGPSNLYKNIALYQDELTAGKVETHFELYTGKPVETITESAITLTELPAVYYNNDWIVLQSV